MNERIKELYKQAHSIRYHDGDPMRDGNPPTVYWEGEVSAAKFAELIVRECINTLEFHGFDDTIPYVKWMATNKLGQHFRVEE